MLKIQWISTEDNYQIFFDFPISQSIQKHPEMEIFLNGLPDDTRRIKNKSNDIESILISKDSFFSYIEKKLSKDQSIEQKNILTICTRPAKVQNKEGLQVNFHQKPFDTTDRYWRFILNQGHFLEYFFNRINWFLAPQNEYVTSFPLHVDLESASTCNMNCPMCYRSELNKTGQIEMDLFRKAVDECAAHNLFSMRLSWRGETLTHPEIREMIAYATRRIPNISFLTNAFYIDDAMIDCFIETGVSYVAVSFDGIGETYEKIRHPARFSENRERLRNLMEKRNRADTLLPQIRLCTIWPAIRENPEAYTAAMMPVSDYMVTNPYINFKGEMQIKKDFICQYPWERIVIGFDGDAQCCTGWNATDIILGNVKEKTIEEMWKSNQMHKIRQIHASGQRMSLDSCAACRHGSTSDPDICIDTILERRY